MMTLSTARPATFVVVLWIIVLASCKSSNPPSQDAIPVRTPEAHVIQDLGNGIYLKEAGWDLPLSVPMKNGDTGMSQFNDSKGKPVRCRYSVLIPLSEFVTNPFEELGWDYHHVKIDSVTKVEVNGKVYKYEVHGRPGERDAKTGRFLEQGPILVYSYVDRDADGIFETLDTGHMGTTLSSWIDDLN